MKMRATTRAGQKVRSWAQAVHGGRPAPRPKRGAALILAVEAIFLAAAVTTVLVQAVQTENMGTDDLLLRTQATYLAESAAEYSIKQLGQAVANRRALASGLNVQVLSGYLPGYAPNPGAGVPEVEFRVFRMGDDRSYQDTSGVDHRFQVYAVSGRALVPDPFNPEHYYESYVNKLVDLDKVPLFQYLAFYAKTDLEMLPGNDANWKGRVHSNRDIYVGVESGRALRYITDYFRASGAIRRTRKDTTPSASNHYMTGTVRIKRRGVADNAPVNDTNYPTIPARGALKTPDGSTVPLSVAPNGYDSSFPGYDGNGDGDVLDPSDLLSFGDGSYPRWDGTVATGAQGVPELAVPTDLSAYRPPESWETPTHRFNTSTNRWEPSATAATHVEGYYLSQANIVIANNRIYDGAGTDITSLVSPNPLSESQLFDGREYNSSQDGATQGRVTTTNIDISKLNQAVRSDTNAPLFPTTGGGSMIYAYRTDSTVKDPRGVRVKNGSVLNNKLTLVSEDPVYIQGNFNVGDGTNPKRGVAVMSDAVNLLSNEWNDSKTASSGLPVPTHTLQINTAMLCGNYETLVGKYNGGLENYPRFHEDWSTAGGNIDSQTGDYIKSRIRGAFVNLFESKLAKGKWVYGGNKYTAPKRDWDFDTDLLNENNLPPGFPISVEASRVVWWEGREMTWWP